MENMSVVCSIPMSLEAFDDFSGNRELFGYHMKKFRGTAQKGTLEFFEQEGDASGEFLRELNACAATIGVEVNTFMNINYGEAAADAEEASSSIGDGDAENQVKHKDTFTRNAKGKANLRMIPYFMEEGRLGTLIIYRNGVRLEVAVPKGCALVCTDELLCKHDHGHGARGRSISIVMELCGELPPFATEAEMTASGEKQPTLPLREAFTPWKPVDEFLGEKLRNFCGGEGGVGSVERMALTRLAGPKEQGKRRPMKAMRELLKTKSEAEIIELARQRGLDMSELAARHGLISRVEASLRGGGPGKSADADDDDVVEVPPPGELAPAKENALLKRALEQQQAALAKAQADLADLETFDKLHSLKTRNPQQQAALDAVLQKGWAVNCSKAGASHARPAALATPRRPRPHAETTCRRDRALRAH